MPNGYRLKHVRQDIRDRILALDATAYAQTASGSATWRESKDVRGPLGGDSRPYAHLSFAVQIDTAPNRFRDGDGAQEEIRVHPEVLVEWAYQIRASDWDDYDLAMDAAQDIVAALLALPIDGYNIDCINAFQPRLLPDGTFLYVQQRFEVGLELSLSTS